MQNLVSIALQITIYWRKLFNLYVNILNHCNSRLTDIVSKANSKSVCCVCSLSYISSKEMRSMKVKSLFVKKMDSDMIARRLQIDILGSTEVTITMTKMATINTSCARPYCHLMQKTKEQEKPLYKLT
jgi:hypothetical protein